MAKASIPDSESAIERVLDALSAVVARSGHSLSWYSSKKGRIWITLKGFQPTIYTTSAECTTMASYRDALDTFVVCIYHHFPKLTQEAPPLTTWLTDKAVQDTKLAAYQWLATEVYRADPETGELAD